MVYNIYNYQTKKFQDSKSPSLMKVVWKRTHMNTVYLYFLLGGLWRAGIQKCFSWVSQLTVTWSIQQPLLASRTCWHQLLAGRNYRQPLQAGSKAQPALQSNLQASISWPFSKPAITNHHPAGICISDSECLKLERIYLFQPLALYHIHIQHPYIKDFFNINH